MHEVQRRIVIPKDLDECFVRLIATLIYPDSERSAVYLDVDEALLDRHFAMSDDRVLSLHHRVFDLRIIERLSFHYLRIYN